jgi:hypothetical protein
MGFDATNHQLLMERSDLVDGNAALRTHFNAGLATKTVVNVYRIGLAVHHLKYLARTGVYTLFVANTLILVNNHFPHGSTSTLN